MKNTIKKITIVFLGILLNIGGRAIAQYFNLPIWFDMVGTFIVSYYVGIWGGIVAGVFNNIISSIYDVTALVYSLTSAIAALMMGILIKKKHMSTPLKAVVSSFWMGIVSTIVSTPLNLIFYNGYSGNRWGDTLVNMLRWYDVSDVLSALAGEAVVEIVDKQICVLVAFLFVFCWNHRKRTPKKQVELSALLLALLVGLSGVMAPLPVKAAEPEGRDDNFVKTIYNNTNGMLSSEANVICETDDGYIWIGSYAGLIKYDGNQFTLVREGGLVNVVGMMIDSKGRLWIGTNDAGIARYENGTYTFFTQEDGLPSNSIRCFAEDSEGNIYVGTSGEICRFCTDDTMEVLDYDISFVKDMAMYQDMLIALDNKGHLYALDGEQKWEMRDSSLKDYFYYALASTSHGLIAGTETGELFVLDVSNQEIKAKKQIAIEASQISTIFEDSKGRIWIATESGFGYLDQDEVFRKMEDAGFDSSIVCFHEDYQGNIWAASTHYGVMKLANSPFMNLFEKAGLEKEYVNAVQIYNHDYYCATDDGLVILDGVSHRQITDELTDLTQGSRIRALFTDSKERLWLCTYNGLVCYDQNGQILQFNTENSAVSSDRFRCMTELSDGTLVAGTADGINIIRGDRVSKTLTAENGLQNTQILSLVEGEDGAIWAGSDGSGIYIIKDDKLEQTYTVEDGLSSNIILRIVPHKDGYLVVTSNALCHIDLDGKIRRLDNFPYFNNYDIIIEDETAYITCSAGMYEMEMSKLCADSDEQIRFYGAGEGLFTGLTANSWNEYSQEHGLLLCSNSGVIVYQGNPSKAESEMKFGIVSADCDGTKISMDQDNTFLLAQDSKNLSLYASVHNYGFTNVKVKFFVKELESNPKLCNWNEIEPIKLYKPEKSKYTVCLQILDNSGQQVMQEKTYSVTREIQDWEKPIFKTYLVIVITEIILFTIFSIVSMILFVIRKDELERLQIDLEKKVQEQTGELDSQQKTIKKLFLQTVTALSEAVDAKDRYTSGHSKRVAEYARMLAAKMGKSKEEQEEIYRAGLLHDIGKIRIPAEIINKPGKLTEEEYNIIKIHPVTGYHILRSISDNNYIAVAAKYHHERYDGKGYPNGLAGEKIPEVARILGVADAYDAMASNRSYRDTLSQEVVRREIEKGKGTQFDPHIADIMLQMIDEDKNYTLRQNDLVQRSILTVDDEAMNNKIIAHIMRDEPMYEIVSACSGKEALSILEQQSFDLIFLDVKMPEMDGLETLKIIRQKYQTPVVLMTGDKTLDASMEFAELGCSDYITKPFLPILVKEIVHNMTERTNIQE